MPSGGYRAGAGRPRKPAAQKILEGNPGKRPIEVLDTKKQKSTLPKEPPAHLSEKAKEIYMSVVKWLDKIGCTMYVLPYNIEEYAHCKARWFECEMMNNKHGLVVKNPSNGNAVMSPYVALAQTYLKQTNDCWAKIYSVVRESALSNWEDSNPNDDVMEQLLRGNK
ncbi:MAG: terminase [Clostridia bacterium]|nr:terminase [Clostridia bacterium]